MKKSMLLFLLYIFTENFYDTYRLNTKIAYENNWTVKFEINKRIFKNFVKQYRQFKKKFKNHQVNEYCDLMINAFNDLINYINKINVNDIEYTFCEKLENHNDKLFHIQYYFYNSELETRMYNSFCSVM